MSFYQRGAEKRKSSVDYNAHCQDLLENSDSSPPRSESPKMVLEQDKRMRREIANSNERRRMQSINHGFNALRSLIPQQEGEKLSKAAILTHTTNYISHMLAENSRLQTQNQHYRRMLNRLGVGLPDADLDPPAHSSPIPKRIKRDTECSDEGIGLSSSEGGLEMEDLSPDEVQIRALQRDHHQVMIARQVAELRAQLEHERRLRLALEEQADRLQETRAYIRQLRPEDPTPHSFPGTMPALPLPSTPKQDPDAKELKWTPSQEVSSPPSYVKEEAPAPAPRVPALPQELAASPDPKPGHTSMSRRNLETIVKAIRHLEGDMLQDLDEVEAMATNSDREEERPSDCCGRVSPVSSESPGSSPRSLATTATISIQPNVLPLQPSLLHAAFPRQFISSPVIAYSSS